MKGKEIEYHVLGKHLDGMIGNVGNVEVGDNGDGAPIINIDDEVVVVEDLIHR